MLGAKVLFFRIWLLLIGQISESHWGKEAGLKDVRIFNPLIALCYMEKNQCTMYVLFILTGIGFLHKRVCLVYTKM